MKKYTLFISILAAVVLTVLSCTRTKGDAADAAATTDMQPGWPGDSTVYGLACDGCTDTILVVLTDTSHDPDTFNILAASRSHHVFGHPHIGDLLAVVPASGNPRVADVIVDLENLKGEWCYTVMPELRQRADMTEQALKATLPDSLLKELMQPREYGFEIKSDYAATPIGLHYHVTSSDEESPVIYPRLKRYRDWHIFNGRLVLTETVSDSLGNSQPTSSDTAAFVTLRSDTLVLRFSDGVKGYYRKAAVTE